MKFPHHEIPLFKPLLFYILGIIVGEHFRFNIDFSSLLIYLIFGLLVFTVSYNRILKSIHSALIILTCFAFGYVNHLRSNDEKGKWKTNTEQTFTLRIDKVLPYQKHKKCVANILSSLDNEDHLVHSENKILLFFKNSVGDSNIKIGNEYLVKGKPFQIQKSNNPYCFDYAQYLKRQGIYYQLFVNPEKTKLLRTDQNSKADQLIIAVRNRCLNIFSKHFHDKSKLGVLQAMVLGKRDGLEEEINQAFIDTGAIHVLAVSGLHVGILCMFISILFKLLEPLVRVSSVTQGLISLFFIWLFAAITGGSPAVCRAALMFSLFYIAKDILHRPVSMYNVLCGTGFILLAINPNQLFKVGFQFSFLAVISIVFFYPYISRLLVTRYKFVNYFYSSVALGIAAQILVFPLSIYYFNKFANSFLISSLFVVQFAMVILVSGLVLLLLEIIGLEIINHYLTSPFLDLVLEKFNWLIQSVQALPLSSSEELWIDKIQMLIIYLIILSIMFFLKRGRKYFYVGMIFFFLYVNYSTKEKINTAIQKCAYIYDAKDLSIDLILGNQVFHYTTDSIERGEFIYEKNRLAHGIDFEYDLTTTSSNAFEFQEGMIRIGNKIIAFANVETFNKIKEGEIIDYVLVSSRHQDLLSLNIDQINNSEIILDGSLKFWEVEKYLNFIEEQELKVYNIKIDGAKKIYF